MYNNITVSQIFCGYSNTQPDPWPQVVDKETLSQAFDIWLCLFAATNIEYKKKLRVWPAPFKRCDLDF